MLGKEYNACSSALCNFLHSYVISSLFKNTLRLIYLSLVQSVIRYGITGWGCVSKSIRKPLEPLQKRIIKICFKKPIDYPTHFLFSEFNTFTLDQVYKYTLLTVFHKNKDNFNTFWHTRNTRTWVRKSRY